MQRILEQQRSVKAVHAQSAVVAVAQSEIGKDFFQPFHPGQTVIGNVPVGLRNQLREWIGSKFGVGIFDQCTLCWDLYWYRQQEKPGSAHPVHTGHNPQLNSKGHKEILTSKAVG